jgi:hypothetical protein
MLYNQAAKQLRAALLGRPHTVVINVPYRRDDTRAAIATVTQPDGALVAADNGTTAH